MPWNTLILWGKKTANKKSKIQQSHLNSNVTGYWHPKSAKIMKGRGWWVKDLMEPDELKLAYNGVAWVLLRVLSFIYTSIRHKRPSLNQLGRHSMYGFHGLILLIYIQLSLQIFSCTTVKCKRSSELVSVPYDKFLYLKLSVDQFLLAWKDFAV
jgi:hypothetical protein